MRIIKKILAIIGGTILGLLFALFLAMIAIITLVVELAAHTAR
jgi:hypothetical protein